MTKDLVQLQKDNIRILVYASPRYPPPNDHYKETKVSIVVGSEDMTLGLGEYKQLVSMIDSLKRHIA